MDEQMQRENSLTNTIFRVSNSIKTLLGVFHRSVSQERVIQAAVDEKLELSKTRIFIHLLNAGNFLSFNSFLQVLGPRRTASSH